MVNFGVSAELIKALYMSGLKTVIYTVCRPQWRLTNNFNCSHRTHIPRCYIVRALTLRVCQAHL